MRFLEYKHRPQSDGPDTARPNVDAEVLHFLDECSRVFRIKGNEGPGAKLVSDLLPLLSSPDSTYPLSFPRRFCTYSGYFWESFSNSEKRTAPTRA